jgi:hypothetical protein
MNTTEIWEEIEGYRGMYLISNSGNVMRKNSIIKNNEIVSYILQRKNLRNNKGYKVVTLFDHSKAKTVKVHRLVAKAFIPNPNNLPCVNHKDGIKSNNDMNNLEWCNIKFNNQHAYNNGLKNKSIGENSNFNKLKEHQVIDILNNCNSSNKEYYMEKLNVSRSLINSILSKRVWKHLKTNNE